MRLVWLYRAQQPLRWLWQRLRRRWLFEALGLLALSLLIWFGGPLLGLGTAHPLAGSLMRIFTIAAMLLLWGGWRLFKWWQLRKRNDAMVDAIAETARPDPKESEQAILSQKLDAALEQLKARGGKDKQLVYAMPWYAVIGQPGTGKTTALMNSGLRFPLADGNSDALISGAGGTRHVDFWFTDKAVIIDTAGRYTSQDSDSKVDAAGWKSLLSLLREHRPLQPLNGLIVTAPVTALMQGGKAVTDLAALLRARLRDVQDQLGLRLPVYLLITKMDMVGGFDECFESLPRSDRDQVWGVTFPLGATAGGDAQASSMDAAFTALLGRLSDMVLDRLHRESDLKRRSRIHGFPQEMALLRAPLSALDDAMRADSKLDPQPMLRGIYFISGTQQGTTIDRILAGLQPALAQGESAPRPNSGRSFFVKSLIEEVILPESGLAGRDPRAERRRRLLYAASTAAALGLLFTVTLLWVRTWMINRSVQDDLAQAVQAHGARADALKSATTDPYDPRVLAALTSLRQLPGSSAMPQQEGSLTLGLGQSRQLSARIDAQYHKALQSWMVPSLMRRLEGDVRANLTQPDRLYDSLRSYLMVANQGPMNREALAAWARRDAETLENLSSDGRRDLVTHILAAAAIDRPSTPLDKALVAQARQILAREPVALRLFSQIKLHPLALKQRSWNANEHLGPLGREAEQIFDPALAQAEIPGLFTREGYRVFMGLLAAQNGDAAEQIWVMGGASGDASDMGRLRADIARLYSDEYINRWRQVVEKMKVAQPSSPQAIQRNLLIASGQTSPLRSLMRSIADTNNLVMSEKANASLRQLLANSRLGYYAYTAGRYKDVAADVSPDVRAIEAARQSIVDYFARLRLFVGSGSGSEMDVSLSLLASVANKAGALAGVAAAGDSAAAGAAAQAVAVEARSVSAQLNQTASSGIVPEPMRSWMGDLADLSSNSVTRSRRAQLGAAYSVARADDICQSKIAGRFPLRLTGADMSLADFNSYFRPLGFADRFFTSNLQSYTNSSVKPWRLTAEAQALGVAPQIISQYERAADIRSAFFPGGSPEAKVYFLVSLRSADSQAARVTFSLGQQSATFESENTPPKPFVWPDPFGAEGASLEVAGTDAAASSRRAWNGPWALFRMLGSGTVQKLAADQILLQTSTGNSRVILQIKAASVPNPFTSTAFAQFQCPGAL